MAHLQAHRALIWRLLAFLGVVVAAGAMSWFLTAEDPSERLAVLLVAGGLLAALGAWTAGAFLALRCCEEDRGPREDDREEWDSRSAARS